MAKNKWPYGPTIRTASDVVKMAQHTSAGLPDGRWVPARTLGYGTLRHRIHATWLVWTGRADALLWEGQ